MLASVIQLSSLRCSLVVVVCHLR
uniref:Uncharacterized protein n=1 Tax=Anguilla anguilla TaxID=7936 RepID=A0A0E9QF53_ANGAN